MADLKFYVLNHDFNTDKIYSFNVYDNCTVKKSVEKLTRKYLRKKDEYEFYDFIKKERYYGWEAYLKELRICFLEEWARVEYEISVGAPFETDCKKLRKMNCYDQIVPNLELIARDAIYQIKKEQKEKSKKRKENIE